jgi:hypothetical protein
VSPQALFGLLTLLVIQEEETVLSTTNKSTTTNFTAKYEQFKLKLKRGMKMHYNIQFIIYVLLLLLTTFARDSETAEGKVLLWTYPYNYVGRTGKCVNGQEKNKTIWGIDKTVSTI